MASNLSTFRGKVQPRLQDGAGKLNDDGLNGALAGALGHFQQVRPRQLAELVTGNGAFDYILDGLAPKLAAWVEGLSSILEIVYPWDATTPRPPVLDSSEYMVVRLSTGIYLRFLAATPTAPDKFHVLYTGPHVLTEATSTVPTGDEEAFADLATSYACDALASYYSQSTDGSLQADTVAHLSKAQEYRAQAKRWRDAYLAKMGGDSADGPASGVAAVASVFPTSGRNSYFFHGRR